MEIRFILQIPKQATSSGASRFESFRAHHFHRNHHVMALRPGDRNPLVHHMAGAHDSTGVAGVGLGGVIPNTKGHPKGWPVYV
jgi:hypothetical protein